MERRPVTRTFGLAVVWIVCALLIALGTAGIVSAMEHQPGSASRAELTWARATTLTLGAYRDALGYP